MESIFKSFLDEMLYKGVFESQEMVDEFVTLNGLEFDDVSDFMDAVKDFLESHFEEERLKERMEDDEKMAEILGVATDADERTIKVAYRKLALKFRKWCVISALDFMFCLSVTHPDINLNTINRPWQMEDW